MTSPARPRRAAAAKVGSAVTKQIHSPASDLSSLPDEDRKAPIKPSSSKSPRKVNGSGTKASKSAIIAEVEAKVEAVEASTSVKGKGKAKAIKRDAAADEDEAPKKKPRVSKASIFPPADLDPSVHPVRKGHPIFKLPDLPAGSIRNGGISQIPVDGQPMLLGAHTSIAGGPATALLKAGMLGANGLAMFVKSQRQWKAKDYEEEAVERFRSLLKPKEEGGELDPLLFVVGATKLTVVQVWDTLQIAYSCTGAT